MGAAMNVNPGFDYVLVQHRACPVCGHDTSATPPGDLAAAVVDSAVRWHEFLDTVCDHPGGVAELCARRREDVWCAAEYACHVRDVLAIFARRIELTLMVDSPQYVWWDHEAAVVSDHYVQQDPRAVADDIGRAATELAALVQPLSPQQLKRSGTRDGAMFTIDGLIRFATHEALHHLADARSAVAVAA